VKCVCLYVLDEQAGCCDVTSDVNDELLSLRAENTRLTHQLQLQRESMSRHSPGGDSVQLDFIHAQQELSRCKEALIGSVITYFVCCFIRMSFLEL